MNDRLQEFKQIAIDRGGLCLSDNYINSQTKMLWQCAKGHRWQIPPNNIKQGSWCKECSKIEAGLKRRTPIEFFKEYAISKGGVCLTDEYQTQKTRLTFQCSQKHQWTTAAGSLKSRKSWCPYCASPSLADTPELKQQRLLELQKTAKERGGKLLSTEYINTKTKYKFQCVSGHTWATSVDVIRGGSWCKKCATKKTSDSQRDNLEIFKKIIEEKGGKCLTTEYTSQQKTKILVECDKGHRWLAFPQHLKRGLWCRKCNGSAPHTLEDIIRLAESRGGKCLSTEYKNDMTNILWQCSENHTWEATPNNIKRDKWCPTCSEGLGERICRLYFQRYFGFYFIKVRPEWLRSSKGFPLELDGYCEELNIAFEHQGRQHYSEVSFFSKQTNYDEEKRILCEQRGVTLIEIPEVLNDTKIKDLKKFIIQECEKKNVELPTNINEIEITPFEIFTFTKNQERKLLAQRAEQTIISQGGTLLETHLSDKGISFKVLCSNNHHWNVTNTKLFRDKSCPHCKREAVKNIQSVKKEAVKLRAIRKHELREEKERLQPITEQKLETRKLLAAVEEVYPKTDRKELSIQKMLAVANSKNGECLSTEYLNNTTPLLWRCEKGHEWEASPNKIKSGSWCHHCAGNMKSTIEEIIQLVQQRGGKCFSNSYKNNYTKIDIECEQGHRFISAAKSIKKGNWCPQCAINERANKRRLSIEDMQVLAKRKQGKCLSTSYTDSNTKLLWECLNHHQFYSKPGNVNSGKWCPKCAIEKIVDKASIERKKIIEQILIDKQGKAISISDDYNRISDDYNRISEATWQCNKGHIWTTRIANILVGHWCARCGNKENWNSKRTTIQEVKQLAQSKNGDCLSSEYIDATTKLKFVCQHGHTWTAIWSNIKSKGSWCPQCASKHRWDNRRQKQLILI